MTESSMSSTSIEPESRVTGRAETGWAWHDEAFRDVLGPQPNLELVLECSSYPFAHEAGVFFSGTDELFITSNRCNIDKPGYGSQEVVHISKVLLKESRIKGRQAIHETIHSDTIPMANGGVNYKDGVLFCAQGSRTRPSGLYWMSRYPPYEITPILTDYHGVPFNSINDVIVSKKDGSIWFTDPPYGSEQGYRNAPELPSQIYSYMPRGSGRFDTLRAVADGFGHPNGLCFSPDESILYITDTDKVRGSGKLMKDRPSSIYSFDVIRRQGQTLVSNRRLFAFVEAGIPDGIKCDTFGRVYSGCGDGIHVFSPGGVPLGRIQIPGGVANFCFGNSGEIYALNEYRLWRVTLASSVRGALLSTLPEARMPVRLEKISRLWRRLLCTA